MKRKPAVRFRKVQKGVRLDLWVFGVACSLENNGSISPVLFIM
jgi:hypothetical protein